MIPIRQHIISPLMITFRRPNLLKIMHVFTVCSSHLQLDFEDIANQKSCYNDKIRPKKIFYLSDKSPVNGKNTKRPREFTVPTNANL